MMSSSMLWIAVAVVALVWIMYKQTTWQPVIARRMWLLPIALGAIGLYTLYISPPTVSGLEVGVIALELVVAAGTGAAMGWIARFRPITQKNADRLAASRRRPESPVTNESRTGWWGLALWLVAILFRGAIAAIGFQMGAALAASVAMIYLGFAANRAARAGVLLWRLDRNAGA